MNLHSSQHVNMFKILNSVYTNTKIIIKNDTYMKQWSDKWNLWIFEPNVLSDIGFTYSDFASEVVRQAKIDLLPMRSIAYRSSNKSLRSPSKTSKKRLLQTLRIISLFSTNVPFFFVFFFKFFCFFYLYIIVFF